MGWSLVFSSNGSSWSFIMFIVTQKINMCETKFESIDAAVRLGDYISFWTAF